MESQTNTRARHSHALSLYAGECTNRVAEHYPFPHTEILAAPSGRLHLACFSIVHGHTSDDDLEGIVFEKSWSRAIPKELAGTLQSRRHVFKKLEIPGFLPHTYRALKKVMTDKSVESFFRTASSISENDILKMFVLPEKLRLRSTYNYLHNAKDAELFKTIFEVLVERLNVDEQALLQKIARSRSERQFWKILWCVTNDACPEFPELPVKLPKEWRQLRTGEELAKAGKKYGNCLGGYHQAYSLKEAIIVRENKPTAIASISSRYNGALVVEDLTGPGNDFLGDEVRKALLKELEAVGITEDDEGTHGFIDRLKDEISGVYRSDPELVSRRANRIANAMKFLQEASD